MLGLERKKSGWPARAAAAGGKRRKVSLMTAKVKKSRLRLCGFYIRRVGKIVTSGPKTEVCSSRTRVRIDGRLERR